MAVVGYCVDSDLGILEGCVTALLLASRSLLLLSSLILLNLVRKCVYLIFSYCDQVCSSIEH